MALVLLLAYFLVLFRCAESIEEWRHLKYPQRILITGGAGFIGSHTADLLLQQGRQVLVLDNLSSGRMENLNLRQPDLDLVEGDVLEYPLLEKLVHSVDAVLHLAAIASVPMSIENPIYTFQVNTQGLLHVLEAVRKASHPIRLVFASSAAVYGDVRELPCRDDIPLTSLPLSPYAQQKIDTEQYADLYRRLHNIPSLALRYFNAYGSRQDPISPYSGVISRYLDLYRRGGALTVFGDGQQSRDFIHVSDVARANVLALDSAYSGALNVATGQPQTLLQLIDYIKNAGGHSAAIHSQPARTGDIKASYAATEMAKEHIGFRYQVPLFDGIREMVML